MKPDNHEKAEAKARQDGAIAAEVIRMKLKNNSLSRDEAGRVLSVLIMKNIMDHTLWTDPEGNLKRNQAAGTCHEFIRVHAMLSLLESIVNMIGKETAEVALSIAIMKIQDHYDKAMKELQEVDIDIDARKQRVKTG